MFVPWISNHICPSVERDEWFAAMPQMKNRVWSKFKLEMLKYMKFAQCLSQIHQKKVPVFFKTYRLCSPSISHKFRTLFQERTCCYITRDFLNKPSYYTTLFIHGLSLNLLREKSFYNPLSSIPSNSEFAIQNILMILG